MELHLPSWRQHLPGGTFAHVGDARVYHLQSDGQLARLTIDDTVQAQLERLGRSPSSVSQPDGRLCSSLALARDLSLTSVTYLKMAAACS